MSGVYECVPLCSDTRVHACMKESTRGIIHRDVYCSFGLLPVFIGDLIMASSFYQWRSVNLGAFL